MEYFFNYEVYVKLYSFPLFPYGWAWVAAKDLLPYYFFSYAACNVHHNWPNHYFREPHLYSSEI